MKYSLKFNESGNTLVEVLVAIGLAGIMLPALLTALVTSNAARPTVKQQLAATLIMQQMTEEVRAMRNASWSNISSNGVSHPTDTGSNFILSSGPTTVGDFTYQLEISDVGRVLDSSIVDRGGVTDPSTKRIIETVSWSSPHPSSISSTLYLSRWQNGNSWTQTSAADFDNDTVLNVTFTNVSGGEAELTPGKSSGTLESQTFDAGSDASFNYLDFNDEIPSGTNIKIQVATNNDNSTWNYIGPDGTNTSFFTSPGGIPLQVVNGRYFRYQVSFSTSNTSLPSLDDVTMTYTK